MKRFGKVWCASGARGFFGEGYWFHKFVPGLDWTGSTFVAKTTTLGSRMGNMDLDFKWGPRRLFPNCIKIYPIGGYALNAIGLSGPGANILFRRGLRQRRPEPLMLSFMVHGQSKATCYAQIRHYSQYLETTFLGPLVLQINLSCPNTEQNLRELRSESQFIVDYFRRWLPQYVKLVAKINILWPVSEAAKLNVDAICIGNTLPWGSPGIDWKKLFGTQVSPLALYGGGGLSGAPLLPLTVAWVEKMRASGYTGHLNACGGIMSVGDVDAVKNAGADSISLGTVAMLRGWRLRSIIAHARKVL